MKRNAPLKRHHPMRRKWQEPERICEMCGATFTVPAAWAKRSKPRFCSLACSHEWRTTPEGRAAQSARMMGKQNGLKHGRHAGRDKPHATDLGRFRDPAETCRWPGCARQGAKLDQHHVIYRQEVKRRAGDVWDGDNALTLCASHHATHHHQLTPCALTTLRDENYAYAAALLGPAAYDYLRRRYAGEDPRVDALLTVEAMS